VDSKVDIRILFFTPFFSGKKWYMTLSHKHLKAFQGIKEEREKKEVLMKDEEKNKHRISYHF